MGSTKKQNQSKVTSTNPARPPVSEAVLSLAEPDEYHELLMGCGSRTVKDISLTGKEAFHQLTRLDYNGDHKPDVVWDLRQHPLPFEDNTFDEIHAYEVLEHLAQQGDYRFFFAEFSEYWRILKPGGHFFASSPDYRSKWAWGDPSHTRVMQPENLVFLDQDAYSNQVGVTTMSDFRFLYKAHFKARYSHADGERFQFVLEAIK